MLQIERKNFSDIIDSSKEKDNSMKNINLNELTLATKNNLNIDTNNTERNDLSEVVVVGYGVQKKSNISGAISKLQSKDLENKVITRLEDALKGGTSGLLVTSNSGNPGASSTVAIRGITSINSFDPLYVVDGVAVAGGIDYLNSSDIESIEVLKDAASAAIYGTQAASGVVLVTTKNGKKGALKINFNFYKGLQSPDNMLKLLNASQYATLRNEAAVAAGKDIIFGNPRSYGTGTDWQAQVFNNNANIENYELSFSGGNNISTFFTSFSYYNQAGIVSSSISNYERYSVRFNASNQIKPWLKFGNNLAYSYNKTLSGVADNNYYGGPLASAINLDPITPVLQLDPIQLNSSTYANNINALVKNNEGKFYAISPYVQNEMSNPLAYAKINEGNFGYTNKIVGNIFIEIEPIHHLKMKSNFGVDMAFYGNEQFQPIYYLSPSLQLNNNNFQRIQQRAFGWTSTHTISYSMSFLKGHTIDVLGGIENRVVPVVYGVGATYAGLPVNNFSQASMNYSIATSNQLGYGWEGQDYKISSLFFRLNYNYLEKYLLTGVLRRDGSSHFGSNNQYGYFPSFSLGWVVNKERFWNKISMKVLSALKIRASYGINGNDNLSAFQYVSTIANASGYTLGSGGQFYAGRIPAAPANPDLKWEKTSQLNFGADLTLFNFLKVTLDYFIKNTSDMLMQNSIPMYVGASNNPWGNVATMTNKGFEIELDMKKTIKDYSFGIKGNFSYIKNEVTHIGSFDFIEKAFVQSSAFAINRIVVGRSIGEFYGFESMGIFQTQAEINDYKSANGVLIQQNAKPGDFKWKDLNGDGKINEHDRTFLGSPLPNMMFGISVNFGYKGFDFSVAGQGVYGNKIYQAIRRLDIVNANYTNKYWGRWTGPGTSNSVPRLSDNDNTNYNFTYPSNFYIEDGSFFRIRTIQIGYTFPSKWMEKIKIDKVRVYMSINNLYTFTNYSGYNPEIGGGTDAYGVDRGIYPVARSFMFGCNLQL